MKEKVVTLGSSRSLVGILCEPASAEAVPNGPAVILLNAGMVHRIGPFQLNTMLSRCLATAGYTSIRLDLSGIGDSTADTSTLSQDEQMLEDVSQTIDFLTASCGFREIILIGLCTGADNAHKVAVADIRVTSAIFLDGYTYPTTKFYLNRYLPVILDPKRFIQALLRRLKLIIDKFISKTNEREEGTSDEPKNLFIWHLPAKSDTSRELEILVRRKTTLCYVYTAGSSYRYNYLHQFREAFNDIDFNGLLTECFFPEMDHTYILANDREKLIQFIIDWMVLRQKLVNQNE